MGGASGILGATRDYVMGIWTYLQNLYTTISTNQGVLLAFNTAVGILRDIWNGLFSVFTSIYAFIVTSLIPGIQQTIVQIQTAGIIQTIITIVAGAVGLLVMAFNLLWPSVVALANTIITQLFPALMNLWNAIAPILLPILNVLLVVLGVVAGIIGVVVVAAIWVLINAIRIFITVFSAIIQVVAFVVGVIAGIIGGIINILTLPFRIAFDVVKGIMSGQNFSQIFNNVLNTIRNVLSGVWDAITNPFRNAFKWVSDSVSDLAKKLADKLNPFQRHSPSLYDLVNRGTNAMGESYKGFFDDVTQAANAFNPNVAPDAVNGALGVSGPAAAAGGGNVFQIDVSGVLADSPAAKRAFGYQLVEHINEAQRAKNAPELLGGTP
jgi:phage-related protein